MISLVLPWIVVLGPVALLIVGLVPASSANRKPAIMARLGGGAAWTAVVAAILATAGLAAYGRVDHVFMSVGPVAVSVYFDQLSAVMLLLVSFIGAVVIRYARNYLEGDLHHGSFTKWLALTLSAVLILMIAGNLAMFAAGWIAMSLCLHQLLVFYPERPAAQIVARKKFIISRIGDVCLIAALALIWNAFGSLDFKTLFAAAQAAGANGVTAADFHAIAGLLVIGALLKSAQFPFHGWLPEVMETPTPVSALLHAGIINAGGFLIVRMSDVVGLSTPALNVLAIVGATTALFGALTMLTQNSIKVWLAHSTIAQMGFMMLQCGLGAFSSAVLHIVAHALYKAHAFLSSGSVVEIAKSSWTPSASGRPHPIRMLGALTAAVALVFAVGPRLWRHARTETGDAGPGSRSPDVDHPADVEFLRGVPHHGRRAPRGRALARRLRRLLRAANRFRTSACSCFADRARDAWRFRPRFACRCDRHVHGGCRPADGVPLSGRPARLAASVRASVQRLLRQHRRQSHCRPPLAGRIECGCQRRQLR